MDTVPNRYAPALFDPIPDETCWTVARATRFSVLIDGAAYFRAVLHALRAARRSIWLIGWTFDPRTRLDPENPAEDTAIGPLLKELGRIRPELKIRVLIWNAEGLSQIARRIAPDRARTCFRGSAVDFATDGTLAFGAAMHRKLLVVDDCLAFCPNDDFAVTRWDDTEHRDRNPARRRPSGHDGPPWHANHAMLQGPVAGELGNIAREMWKRATGEQTAPTDNATRDLWPDDVTPLLRDIDIAITGTEPERAGAAGRHEGLAHALNVVAAARRSLYVEATYLTSTRLRDALKARLKDPDGPEIVIIAGRHAPSFFDRAAMDPPRSLFLKRLRASDVHGRLSVLTPRAPGGRRIRVHAKLMIADDRLLRMGSFNFSNRSGGHDMECDVALETPDEAPLRDLRHRLIGHFLGRAAEDVAQAERETRGIGSAIRHLDPSSQRLPSLEPRLPIWRGWFAGLHLGDPEGTSDPWRPWKRGR